MKQFILENFFQIITSIFGGTSFLAWILERKKRKLEEKQLAADALDKMQSAYDKFTEDSLERYKSLREEVEELKKSLQEETKAKLALQKDYNDLKIAYDNLKEEFNDYKKRSKK